MVTTIPLSFTDADRDHVENGPLQLVICVNGLREWFELPEPEQIGKLWITVADNLWEMLEYQRDNYPPAQRLREVGFLISEFCDAILILRADGLIEISDLDVSPIVAKLFPEQGGYFLLEYSER